MSNNDSVPFKYVNLLQYSCLENPMDRVDRQATVHEVAKVGHDLVTKPPPPPFKYIQFHLSLVSVRAKSLQ